MWSADPPQVQASEVARRCAQRTKDEGLPQRAVQSAAILDQNSTTYRDFAATGRCHELDLGSHLGKPGLTDEELAWLYDRKLAPHAAPGRSVHEELIWNARYGLCSYCQYSVASTLDHFLPKSTHKRLSIEPWNLVPACLDCNKELGDGYGRVLGDEFFHPYFMPDLGRWLYCDFNVEEPSVPRYRAVPSASMPAILRMRVINEFEALGLAKLYGQVAASDLVEVEASVSTLRAVAGPEGVREHLLERAEMSTAVDKNHRKVALFEALANASWYCESAVHAHAPIRVAPEV